ncbi:MAG: lysoplasmalogenase [Rudaea sp.]|nr:lysoplasmalogenase [Rudaea sp.]
MPISTVLYAAAALSALLAIGADWEERRHRAYYILKPLTTLLILGAALAQVPTAGGDYRFWIVLGLGLSLLGDICLMFEGDGWFTAGLASFLLAHLGFIVAFLQGISLGLPPAWTILVLAYAIGLCTWLLPRAGELRIPVAVYCLVLLAMVLAAAMRLQTLGKVSAKLALAGALLFVLSDSCLAIRQFGGPYRGAQLIILLSYWLAIGLIAASISSF